MILIELRTYQIRTSHTYHFKFVFIDVQFFCFYHFLLSAFVNTLFVDCIIELIAIHENCCKVKTNINIIRLYLYRLINTFVELLQIKLNEISRNVN